MATGILRRGSTQIEFEIYQENGGLAFARDVGKPRQRFHAVSAANPISRDHWSAIETWTVLGMLIGPGSYSRAKNLVENLIKPHSQGVPLILDMTSVPGVDVEVEVAVPQSTSCMLDYQPGIKDRVDLQLTLPLVFDTQG